MNVKHMCLAMLGAAGLLLLPSVLVAQMDPTANPGVQPYPQSPQNINQPAPGQTGSTPATGAQTIQSTPMRDSLGAPGQTGQQMMDKQFVRTAAQTGMADLKFATLATQKGSPDIKDLAQKLADDHTTMNKDLDAVADQMGVMLPKKMTKDDQAEYEKLNGLSGKDFDTEYLTYIAKAHWQTLHNFYMEASAAADPDLQAEVVKALGTMHQHVGMVAKVAKDDGITLPPRPPRPAATTASK
jgi:putative membrane protein